LTYIDSSDRLGSGVWVNVSFQKNPRLLGLLGSGLCVVGCLRSVSRMG